MLGNAYRYGGEDAFTPEEDTSMVQKVLGLPDYPLDNPNPKDSSSSSSEDDLSASDILGLEDVIQKAETDVGKQAKKKSWEKSTKKFVEALQAATKRMDALKEQLIVEEAATKREATRLKSKDALKKVKNAQKKKLKAQKKKAKAAKKA